MSEPSESESADGGDREETHADAIAPIEKHRQCDQRIDHENHDYQRARNTVADDMVDIMRGDEKDQNRNQPTELFVLHRAHHYSR
jgi:hypothetical protein